MSDRFKFRVWNTTHKRWADKVSLDQDGKFNTLYFGVSSRFNIVPQEETVIMFCTGLKDKNGKLIYEGHIVNYKFHNDEEGETYDLQDVVEWEDGAFFPIPQEKPSDEGRMTDFEIIGNIYENPELLEK